MKSNIENYYNILGVSKNSSSIEIKKAYKELAKKYHPDKHINNDLADLAEAKFKEINEAYEYFKKNNYNHEIIRGYAEEFSSQQEYQEKNYTGNEYETTHNSYTTKPRNDTNIFEVFKGIIGIFIIIAKPIFLIVRFFAMIFLRSVFLVYGLMFVIVVLVFLSISMGL